MSALYTAKATATGGRAGKAETDDKKISVGLSAPGSDGAGTNPEQLFAAGYAACFGSAVEHVARQKGLNVSPVQVNSQVTLNKDDSGFSISVALDVNLPSIEQSEAQQLVQEAHQVCPYSKATRNNIEVTLQANGKALANAA